MGSQLEELSVRLADAAEALDECRRSNARLNRQVDALTNALLAAGMSRETIAGIMSAASEPLVDPERP